MQINFGRVSVSALAVAIAAGGCFAASCPTVNKFDRGVSAAIDDQFAASLSMSFGGLSNTPLVAVGQPNEDAPVAGDQAGGFTVYQKINGWSVMYAAWNTTGAAGERLGASIGLSDPYLIAGAPGFSNTGRARIFRRPSNGSGYTGTVDVAPTIGGIGSGFGEAVAISSYGGGWAVVGAPTHDFHAETDAGAAFFYTRDAATNTWNNTYTIWGGDFGGNSLDHRGTAVAMAQQTEFAAVGSPNHEDAGQAADHGTVRIVRRLANGLPSGTSVEVAPPSPEAGEHFGAAVAIENDLLVVGAPDEDMTLQEGGFVQAATNGGAIYIFQADGVGNWNFVTKLRAPNPTPNGQFGASVSTDGGLQIAVSEPGTQKVYLFSSVTGSWRYQATLSDPDNAAAGSFGSAVAVRNGDIAVGDDFDDNNSVTNAGAVYMLNLEHDVPTGDTCSNPLQIPAGDYVGCTLLATPSAGNSSITTCGNGGAGQGNDVWFIFQPACDGNAIFDTLGSQFDTVLSVHSGCPSILGGGTTIVCNDDASFSAPNNRASLVTFNFTGGETYYIRVTGYNNAAGQFTLRHLFTYGLANDTCANATTVGSGFGTWAFNTCAATNGGPTAPCVGLAMSNDIWYRWNATANETVAVKTCGSTFDTALVVYPATQANCASLPSAVACNDDAGPNTCSSSSSLTSYLTFNATAGQSYLVRVGGYGAGAFGPGQLTIERRCIADVDDGSGTGIPDGGVGIEDLLYYLGIYDAGVIAADVDDGSSTGTTDGGVGIEDLLYFLQRYDGGC